MYYALMRMTRGLMLCRALRFYVFQFDMQAYHDSGRMKEKTFKVISVTGGLREPPYLRGNMLSCHYPKYERMNLAGMQTCLLLQFVFIFQGTPNMSFILARWELERSN